MSSKVWFTKLQANASHNDISKKVLQLYKEAEFKKIFSKNEFTAVKIHFGEKNNTGHISPEWIRELLEEVKKEGTKLFLTDTNTLYKGQRANSIDHLMQAYEHGYSIENLGVPIIISDGLLSKNYSEVKINGKHFESVKIANDILHSDSLVVLSHLTGHALSGLGAAIKNLAMGCAPRSGKQMQHKDVKPEVVVEKCKSCEKCISWCPKEAITIYDGVIRIDYEKCYGCGECIVTCRHEAIKENSKSSSKLLQEKMAEFAFGAVENKKGKVCYINFLTHITKECDCVNKAQEKVVSDLGIMASYDPVAIDQAAVDMLKKSAGADVLKELWPENDYNIQIGYAEKLGMGSRKYEIINIE